MSGIIIRLEDGNPELYKVRQMWYQGKIEC